MSSLSDTEVINLLLQLAAMLILARVFAEVARKFNQQAVVEELLAVVILGPTILGTFYPYLFVFLFMGSPMTNVILDGIVQSSEILLLFIEELKVDVHLIWSQGKDIL